MITSGVDPWTRITRCMAWFDSEFPGWHARALADASVLDVCKDRTSPLALASESTRAHAVRKYGLTRQDQIDIGLAVGDGIVGSELTTLWVYALNLHGLDLVEEVIPSTPPNSGI